MQTATVVKVQTSGVSIHKYLLVGGCRCFSFGQRLTAADGRYSSTTTTRYLPISVCEPSVLGLGYSVPKS